MKMKRFLASLLVLCLVLSLVFTRLPVSASASMLCGDNLFYVYVYKNSTVYIAGRGDMYDYDYSTQMEGAPNDGFTPEWPFVFSHAVIREGVTSIGTYAFNERYYLRSVTIPKSLTSIGERAFYSCMDLKNVYYAGSEEDWANITIASGNDYLLDATIHYNYTDPDTIDAERCGENATWSFDESTGILTISGTGAMYDYPEAGLAPWPQGWITDIVFDPGITYIGANTFRYIGNMTSLRIPDSITGIGENAFYCCTGLTELILPEGLTSIAANTFGGTSALTDVMFPDSLTDIGEEAFISSGLTDITLPDSVNNIGEGAFQYCENLSSVTLPTGLTAISRYVFNGCSSLTHITIPENVTSIARDAFRMCTSLASVTLPDGLTSIGGFSYCTSLTDIKLPDSLTGIGEYAFSSSGLTGITIPDSVTSIGGSAFWECTGLTGITIPDSVTSIGEYAFKNCTNLTDVVLPSRLYRIDKWTFADTAIAEITLPGNLSKIEDYAFSDCKNLESITIPENVSSIGASAFKDCTALATITLPDRVSSIGSSAFKGCTALTDVILPARLSQISSYAFSGTGLTSITLPENVTTIGNYAFQNCGSLRYITLPDCVTFIDSSAFYGCTGLTDVFYEGSEAQWGQITIYSGNACLTDAAIHYNNTRETDHLRKEWARQHMDYAASLEYVDMVTGTYRGGMLEVYHDMLDDDGIQFYDFADDLVNISNGKLQGTDAELFELLLAELMYSRLDEDLVYELYEENYYQSVVNVLETVFQGASTTANLVIDGTVLTSMGELLDLLKTFKKGTPEFKDTVDKFTSLLDQNFTRDNLCTALLNGAATTGLGIIFDGALEGYNTIQDILTYSYNCVAYSYTSDEFEAVMLALADKVAHDSNLHFPDLTVSDQETNRAALVEALHSFTDSLRAAKKDKAAEVARYAVERMQEGSDNFASGTMTTVVLYGVKGIISCIPVLGQIQTAIDVLSIGLSAAKLFTDIDEQSYRLDMVKKLYCLSMALDSVADDYADQLHEGSYQTACLFDESVNLYKAVQLMALDYMVAYENSLLADAYTALDSNHNYRDAQIISIQIAKYDGKLRLLEGKRVEFQNILCHSSLLFGDMIVDYVTPAFVNAEVYFVACPVSVTVLSDTGEEIAYLSDDACQVADGYELYYHTVELDNGEIGKIAFIPEGYQITINGEGEGTMDIFIQASRNRMQYFLDIPVTENTEGSFADSADDPETVNLVIGDTVYVPEVLEIPLGDVNNDGTVDSTDAYLVVLSYSEQLALDIDQLAAADVNGDGAVDLADAFCILLYHNGQITSFSAAN